MNASIAATTDTVDATDSDNKNFIDRRRAGSGAMPGERRQFGNSYSELSAEGRELAVAIDEYKIEHRRRYITPDEMLMVVRSLGYSRAK